MANVKRDNTGWDDPASEFERGSKKKDGRERAAFSGRYVCKGIEMEFHASEQLLGKYQLRGTISVISPQDGRVLQVVGRERSRRIEALISKGKYSSREEAERCRDKALNVSREIYGRDLSDEAVRASVEDAAEKLFASNSAQIQRVLQQSSRPDTITPTVAFAIYSDEFVEACFNKLKPKSTANYRSQLGKLVRKLPNKPMHQIKPSEAAACIKQLNCNKSEIRRGYLFWQYLIDNRYCTGINPMPPDKRRRESAATRQKKGRTPDCLDLDFQDKLYAELTSGGVSGSDCGIALSVWGGFEFKARLTWSDVHFYPDDLSLVRIECLLPDLSGATHDYGRPVFPLCALILHKRYELLSKKYSAAELADAPVISSNSNPLKSLSNEAFLADANRVLRSIGLPDEMFRCTRGNHSAAAKNILHNTYINDVHTRLGLSDDSGTMSFLCGERLRDVTSDNYTKFNDPDGIARIHAAEMMLSPLQDISDLELAEELPDGRSKYTFFPKTTRKTVGVDCDIRLPPGGEITVMCMHGADTVVTCREIKADGRIKRKRGAHRAERQ